MIEPLKNYFDQAKIPITEELCRALEAYWDEVLKASEHQDLTKITTNEEAFAKHFLDSYLPILFAKECQWQPPAGEFTAIDIGTGGGFPGVPLAMYFEKSTWYLLDARLKKIEFLQTTMKKFQLKRVRPLHIRAEEFSRTYQNFIGKIELITARAIKLDEKLLAEAYRLLSPTGVLIQYAGPSAGALVMKKGKELKELVDFSPKCHPLIENHRVRFFKKDGKVIK